MLFRTHIVFAITIYFLVLQFFEIGNKFVFLIFVVLGAAIVDVDSQSSRIGRGVLFRPLQALSKHRGALHSLLLAVLLSLACSFFNWAFGFGFFLGYVSHLFLDSFTKSGVRLFWPVSDFRFRGWIKSGGLFEKGLFVLLFLVDVYFLFRMFGLFN